MADKKDSDDWAGGFLPRLLTCPKQRSTPIAVVDLREITALITGGAGFVGSAIADQLVEREVRELVIFDNFTRGQPANLARAIAHGPVRIVSGDIRDRDAVASAMRGVNVVFHQAALRVTQCAEDPRRAFEVMVDGTYNVVEAARLAGVSKLVAASSATVYGAAETFPTPEVHHLNDNRTLYGAAKAFNEALLRSFYEMYGLDYVGLRYFNVRWSAHGHCGTLHRSAGALDGTHIERSIAIDSR